MKCEKCKNEIDHIFTSEFNIYGEDDDSRFALIQPHEGACYFETDKNWTGYELTEDEMIERIECPHCKQYPFIDKEIQTDTIVRVVMFLDKEKQDLEARYEKEDYGKTLGIEKVLKILKQKGYDSVRAEIESELKADGEI